MIVFVWHRLAQTLPNKVNHTCWEVCPLHKFDQLCPILSDLVQLLSELVWLSFVFVQRQPHLWGDLIYNRTVKILLLYQATHRSVNWFSKLIMSLSSAHYQIATNWGSYGVFPKVICLKINENYCFLSSFHDKGQWYKMLCCRSHIQRWGWIYFELCLHCF